MKELIDLDLQGVLYGCTATGDDNEDMEGFWFWYGISAAVLAGGHITSGNAHCFCFFSFFWGGVLIDCPRSVLYVVDLVRFRQMAAGVH